MDGMGWNGEVLRALSAPEGVGVEVYVPPPALAETPWFGPKAFILDAERSVVTSPRRAIDGDQGAPCQPHWLEVCLCPAPVCGVSPASAGPGDTAPPEGAECHQERLSGRV